MARGKGSMTTGRQVATRGATARPNGAARTAPRKRSAAAIRVDEAAAIHFPDGAPTLEAVKRALGVRNNSAVVAFVSTLMAASPFLADDEMAANVALAILDQVRPRDPLEGMAVMQMIAAYFLAMDATGRAFKAVTPPARDMAITQSTKCSRTYAALLEALVRYRAKGGTKQRVIVKHVHVNDGGQAIVGAVGRTSRARGEARAR
jgi:hypothetical protein